MKAGDIYVSLVPTQGYRYYINSKGRYVESKVSADYDPPFDIYIKLIQQEPTSPNNPLLVCDLIFPVGRSVTVGYWKKDLEIAVSMGIIVKSEQKQETKIEVVFTEGKTCEECEHYSFFTGRCKVYEINRGNKDTCP